MRGSRVVAVYVLFAGLKAFGQAAVVEPEYANQFDIVTSEGKLVPLERQTSKIEAKAGGFIAVKSTVKHVVPGAQSPVRAEPAAQFVVRLHVGDMDPATVIHLYKLDKDKSSRSVVVASTSVTPFAGVKSGAVEPNTIAVAVEKYGESSFKVTPSQPLAPGEYALVTTMSGQNEDCFGVDAK